MKLSRASIAVLVIQLAIVSSIAAKYLYQRWTCPRVWAPAVAYDPVMVMRGRYISARLRVDACDFVKVENLQNSKPNRTNRNPANQESFPDTDRLIMLNSTVRWGALEVRNGRLVVEYPTNRPPSSSMQMIELSKADICADAHLNKPVDFYLSETARSPFPLSKGRELWVEVTVPPVGPPRPLSLAIKSAGGQWQPLSYR